MSRLLLFHWNAAEAKERDARLRRAGHVTEVYAKQGGEGLPEVRSDPPEAFVIDLERLPSHGRAVAIWLRQQKATRKIPIVFVGGDPAKVAGVRRLIPDATYTSWGRIAGALAHAIAKPPAEPKVPGTMAGYSGTPLPKKLGIREGSTVALLGAPERFETTLGALPEGVRIRRDPRAAAERVLLFTRSQADLRRRFAAATRAMADGGGLWIVWPKKTSGLATDLDGNVVRAFGLGRGLVDYKVCAVDETWSGLLFARRGARKAKT
jgi:CheY-like chemotaxis protein